MSSYKEFVEERDKIDYFVQQGYVIKSVTENLSGSFVLLVSKDQQRQETLHVLTAEARKYFASIMIKQQKEMQSQ